MRRWWYAVVIAIGCVAAPGAVAQEQGQQGPLAPMFADWKHRQGLFQSARWVITGTIEFKGPQLPPGNSVRPWRTVTLLDFVRGRYRQESSDEFPNCEGTDHPVRYRKRVSTQAFDGKTGYAYTHRDINGISQDRPDDLVIGKVSVPGSWFLPPLWPVLYAHGLVPTVHTDVRLDKLPPAYDPEDFEDRGRQTFHGRNCTVVRTEPIGGMAPMYDEFWIDLGQESAIHRHINFTGKNPSYHVDVEWKRTEFGWWPDKWTCTWTENGRVRQIYRLQVESFEGNPAVADADFTLPAEPGMKVRVSEPPSPGRGLNPNLAASRIYQVLPNGSWREVAAKGFTTMGGKELPPERNWAWVWWAAVAAAAMAAGAGFAYYLFRRKRRAAAAGRRA